MLSPQIKDEIQQAYKQLLSSKGLRPRYGQRLMIAEIARTLASLVQSPVDDADTASAPSPVCVVEAGTGTGKTLAYVLGTLPLARHAGKKVILSTATVALQEQVTLRDLPDITQHSGLSFTFALAKGRGRYLCLSRLDQVLRGNDSQDAMLALFGESVDDPSGVSLDTALYQQMLERISRGEWQGDKDDWQGPLTDAQWAPVTVEAGQCAGQRCSNYSRCFFYRARETLDQADCIVANHDLVLVDLALGGGAILPAPEDAIYIFDEAHHLPSKTNKHFSASSRLRACLQWLESVNKSLVRISVDTALPGHAGIASEAATLVPVVKRLADDTGQLFLQIEQDFGVRLQQEDTFSFELGVIPVALQEQAAQQSQLFMVVTRGLKDIVTQLRRQLEEGAAASDRQRAEQWFQVFGGMASHSEAHERLWQAFAQPDPAQGAAPSARWLTRVQYGEAVDIALNSSPVLAAESLVEHLWSRCAGAVLTSATLSALGRFDSLTMRAGLPEHTVYHSIASPFDYPAAASLQLPRRDCDPTQAEQHTRALIVNLPVCVRKDEATLVLFSSRRQLQDVYEGLSADWRTLILCQDDFQKAQLLSLHRERVDAGQGSIIFGLASFAEGVDLPGRYCTHVVIAKIPFAVPNDPIEATLAQWVERQGRNAFMSLAVPDAAFRLVQAAGRLLRSETDTGRITLFDERLVTKFYGKAILDSLPPFRREWLDIKVAAETG